MFVKRKDPEMMMMMMMMMMIIVVPHPHLTKRKKTVDNSKTMTVYAQTGGGKKSSTTAATTSAVVDQDKSLEHIDDWAAVDAAEYDHLSDDVRQIIQRHWGSISTHRRRGQNLDVINIRWPGGSDQPDWLQVLSPFFHQQQYRFRVNFSHGVILRNRETEEFRFFHSCLNNAAVLEQPVYIHNQGSFENFVNNTVKPHNIADYATAERPNSKWQFHSVVNTTFYFSLLRPFGIGGQTSCENQTCVCSSKSKQQTIPKILSNCKRNQLMPLLIDPVSKRPFQDALCFFRCLELYLGQRDEKKAFTSCFNNGPLLPLISFKV